ncbi:hypothetical protein Droror1_Dr00002553 [Drosera rotundifolia]
MAGSIPMAEQAHAQMGVVPNPLQQWNQWQLLDSILPTGGFAHSYGLEAAIQARIVNDQQDLYIYALHVMENTGSLLLPFVYTAALSRDEETWLKLDKMLDAMLTNEVARKASTTQGSALLRIAAAIFIEIPPLKVMREKVIASRTFHFHHAVVFGVVYGLLGFDHVTAQRAYLFMTMRDLVSAATRLNVIGPQGAAVMQHRIGNVAEEVLKKWMDRDVEDACQTMPLLDTVQGCHDYLFSRMFCS